MKKLLVAALLFFTASLSAEPRKPSDQLQSFMRGCCSLQEEAFKVCQERGFKFYIIKKAVVKDPYGQSIEMNQWCKDESGTLIKGLLDNKQSLFEIEYELMGYYLVPQDEMAVNVGQYPDNILDLLNFIRKYVGRWNLPWDAPL